MIIDHKPLEILVVGTGAVGSIFGARAQKTRSRVTVICRSNYDVVKARGIGIRSALWGDSIFRPDRVARSPAEVSHVGFDYVVLATKLSNSCNDSLIESIRPAVEKKTTLVSVQNGVTSESSLGQVFDNPIFSSTCYISCTQKAPGIVEQVSNVKPHAFYIGINRRGSASDGTTELASLVGLDKAFASVKDAKVERWTKMIFNTAWSLSTSLMQMNTHEVLANAEGPLLVLSLAQEAHRVGRSVGVDLAADLPHVTLESARRAAAIVPSMLQDIRQKKSIEVEALCGSILRIAQQNGVHTPILELMYGYLSRLNRILEDQREEGTSNARAEAQTTFDIPSTSHMVHARL